MRIEDPWEFEHGQARLGRHERGFVEWMRDEFDQPDWRPPTVIVVCAQCRGRGVSSLYLGSFSSEELWEDPDFADDYLGGVYDRTCESCGGRNVVEIIDVNALSDEDAVEYDSYMRDAYECDAISRQERMMGA